MKAWEIDKLVVSRDAFFIIWEILIKIIGERKYNNDEACVSKNRDIKFVFVADKFGLGWK